MPQAYFLELMSAPNDSIRANIIEQKGFHAERAAAHFGVSDKKSASERARFPVATARELDSVYLIREENEHVTIARV